MEIDSSKTNGAAANGWNVYRFTDDDRITELVGSAPTREEACAQAIRLGATQIQHGLDGEVINL